MAISVTVRADNAIVIYDENDPRFGVTITSAVEASLLIGQLNAVAAMSYGEDAWRFAGMRAVAEAAADDDQRLN